MPPRGPGAGERWWSLGLGLQGVMLVAAVAAAAASCVCCSMGGGLELVSQGPPPGEKRAAGTGEGLGTMAVLAVLAGICSGNG